MTSISSRDLFAEAVKIIPGGVNSPVRAFGSVGGSPRFIARGAGARIWDVEGNSYIDYVGSWGPLILGHAHAETVTAVCDAARRGLSFGAPTAGEVMLAKMIVERIPSIEMVRLVSSGTEATMTALRVARGFTRREKVIKFSGCYHGHSDAFLVKAGSGAATLGVPTSPGVPAAVAAQTTAVEFNDLDAVREVFSESPDEVAAVIVEPICGNAGVIPPEPGFLQGLRELCTAHGALLILDEVMTGFRIRPGSAQALYGITPDLTTLGKIVGGGLPIGAVGGRADIMKLLAPSGPVYQAGTLSGNPVAVAAGIATLRGLNGAVYDRLETLSARLEAGIRGNLARLAFPGRFQRVGSMATLFFTDRPVKSMRDAASCDTQQFAAYFSAMLAAGIYLPPSQFEAFFISAAHTEEDIDRTIAANGAALAEIR
ncbi:MAG: glutamate-1-semialdehyde 2,1-aminomutase [Candidatus Brocadiia bacterium]|jgi:glutamate-1-semialdehyde 2,1-aminomutase